jgi:hypothetical protein
MKENPSEYPKFISNSPCGIDLFEGKAQDKIAENICIGIIEHRELKIIGVDGGWGAGKSNLVELIKKKLEDKAHFFIYDAWGHQEDLQRRSFLEELTEDLTANKIISDEWKSKLKLLLAKVKETESKRVPKLSIGIIITGLLILLTPLLKMITDDISSKFWKSIILLIPFFIIIVFIIIFYNKAQGKNFFERFKNSFTRLFLEYQNKIEEETKYETISEDEPSVKKFRDWLNDISKDLISQEKKLVIVFDNMDRLPQKKVQELWSSIHVFFAEHKYENIKVILPFDRNHIQNAFKTEDSNNGQNFGDDFINKTFNVVYRVSPPILSDWKNYFRKQWRTAFGQRSDENEDYNAVVQIFDLLTSEITPRKIIAFINEIVTIKQLTKKTIPDRYISLFVVGKNVISQNPYEEIVKPSFLAGVDFLYKDDENLSRYLAALFYQVDPDYAIQIVFTNRLIEVLNKNQSEALLKIGEIGEFMHILENAIAQVTNFENAILAIAGIPKEKLGDEFQRQVIWDCLYKKIIQKPDIKLHKYQTDLLINIKNKSDYLSDLLNAMISSENFNAVEYFENVNSLSNSIGNDINVYHFLNPKNTSVGDFISFVKVAGYSFDKYKVTCDEKELNEYLINYEVDKLPEINFLQFLVAKFNLDEFKAKLEGYIKTPSPTHNKTIMAHIFEMYKLIVKEKPLTTILDDARINNFWQTSNPEEEFYYDLLSMRISKLGEFTASYNPNFNAILEKTDEEVIKKVCSRIEYYIDYGSILLGLKSFNHPLYKAIVNELTVNSYAKSKLSLISVLSSFEEICRLGEIDAQALVKRLNSWSKIAHEKITSENISSIASVYYVESILKIDCDLSSHSIDSLIKYLDSLDFDKWNSVFKDFESYEFKIAKLIHSYKFSQNAFDASKEVLKSIAMLETPITNKQLWNELIERMENDGRSWHATFNSIRDSFCREDNMNVDLFKFFAEWLFKYSTLYENASSLRTIFNQSVITNPECLEIIIKNEGKMPSIIKAAKEEAQDFKDEIRALLKEESSDKLKEFAKFLGISKKKKNDTDSNDE